MVALVRTVVAATHYSEVRSFALLLTSLFACGVAWKYDCSYRALYGVIIAGYVAANGVVRSGGRGRAPRRDLTGLIALVTGANTGIGLETAIALAQQGATVVCACRDANKAQQAQRTIKERSGSAAVESISLDLTSFASIRSAAATFLSQHDHLDLLINNAGVAFCPYAQTKDGLEIQIGTNHYGPFLLTNLLLPALKKATQARIINLTSMAHLAAWGITTTPWNASNYNTSTAYAESKLGNIYFTTHLHRLLQQHGSPITVYAVHPGGVATEIQRHNPLVGKLLPFAARVCLKSPSEGAQTTLYCALSPAAVSGGYHIDCHVEPLLPCAADPVAAQQLWQQSEQITGCKANL